MLGYGKARGAMKRKWIPDASIGFSRSNEPWLRWSLLAVSDRGVDEGGWASSRLRQEVLWMEGDEGRWELRRVKKADKKGGGVAAPVGAYTQATPFGALVQMKGGQGEYDVYRWSRVDEEGEEGLKNGRGKGMWWTTWTGESWSGASRG